ncbi:MAG: type II toxin-antitoxin system Phd/YefM family antitoxin [Bryobacteraceae bacterium]|nr:type II toxin-antitoxin system Phd/YefM family antitoxin [Bryobacteraceae bacterium]
MPQTITVTEFKAKCLSLIHAVSEKGETFTITRRGKPVATLGAVAKRKYPKTRGAWAGWVQAPEVEDFDLTHLYQPDPLLTEWKPGKR